MHREPQAALTVWTEVEVDYNGLAADVKGRRIRSPQAQLTLTGNLSPVTLRSVGSRAVPAVLELLGVLPVRVPVYLEVAPAGPGRTRVGILPPSRLPVRLTRGRYLTGVLGILRSIAPMAAGPVDAGETFPLAA